MLGGRPYARPGRRRVGVSASTADLLASDVGFNGGPACVRCRHPAIHPRLAYKPNDSPTAPALAGATRTTLAPPPAAGLHERASRQKIARSVAGQRVCSIQGGLKGFNNAPHAHPDRSDASAFAHSPQSGDGCQADDKPASPERAIPAAAGNAGPDWLACATRSVTSPPSPENGGAAARSSHLCGSRQRRQHALAPAAGRADSGGLRRLRARPRQSGPER